MSEEKRRTGSARNSDPLAHARNRCEYYEAKLADGLRWDHGSPIMIFAEIRPQMEQLPRDEMLKAMAFLRSRLRADTEANREELARHHTEMDAGKKVRWEDLRQKLGLS